MQNLQHSRTAIQCRFRVSEKSPELRVFMFWGSLCVSVGTNDKLSDPQITSSIFEGKIVLQGLLAYLSLIYIYEVGHALETANTNNQQRLY